MSGKSARKDDKGYIRIEKCARSAAGARVKFLDGAFSSCSAFFECMSDNDRVAVLLTLMERRVRVFLDQTSVAVG